MSNLAERSQEQTAPTARDRTLDVLTGKQKLINLDAIINQHYFKNLALIVLGWCWIPLDTSIVVLALFSTLIRPSPALARRHAARRKPGFQQKTILVTGVGMSKGLALARSFYKAGHRVIGADGDSWACGRVSWALSEYHTLRKPSGTTGSADYIHDLLSLIVKEKVDLWCSCSSVASAVEDAQAKEVIERRTNCKAVQFDVPTTQKLHEKHSFIANTKAIGMTVPETHTITNVADAETVLRQAPRGWIHIMKPISMDDVNRNSTTFLPIGTPQATSNYLQTLNVSKSSPWILQRFIRGPEYCTHALVVNGQVKVFVACESAELLMHYVALPFESKISQAMLRFTKRYATKEGRNFTGHLSFDFMIEQTQLDGTDSMYDGVDLVLYPIECNPRAHTAVVLFNETDRMADAYLSIIDGSNTTSNSGGGGSSASSRAIVTPIGNDKYYWVGHDFVELVLMPYFRAATLQSAIAVPQLIRNLFIFIEHLLFWREGTFERWDPLAWWWLYHVYWPAQFIEALWTGKKWSRINVSTTKMFESA